jgi:hypothetical protein
MSDILLYIPLSLVVWFVLGVLFEDSIPKAMVRGARNFILVTCFTAIVSIIMILVQRNF